MAAWVIPLSQPSRPRQSSESIALSRRSPSAASSALPAVPPSSALHRDHRRREPKQSPWWRFPASRTILFHAGDPEPPLERREVEKRAPFWRENGLHPRERSRIRKSRHRAHVQISPARSDP